MKKSARNEQALFGARGELPYLGSAPIPAAGDRRVRASIKAVAWFSGLSRPPPDAWREIRCRYCQACC